MCGIAGTLSLGTPLAEADRETVARMADMLRHRGPDGAGILHDGRCVLGNTRLKVTDLSDRAALPMANEDGSVWLAFNGALTNFRELMDERGLAARHRFRSSSDAEVLLHLYEEMGIECLSVLSGMFAFCLCDRRLGRAYLVRDFYGLRPVFYALRGRRLHFASEIKALLEVPGLGRDMDRQALWHYFSLGYIPGSMTPFTGIRELQGGWLVEADLATGLRIERRYHEVDYRPDEGMTEAEAAVQVRDAVRESVRRSLAVDAPTGLTLSGGFDTSMLLATAKELGLSTRLHTFSLRVDEPSFDESRYQKVMVEFARPIHHEIVVRPSDIEQGLDAAVAHLDEPSVDGAAVPTFMLAREARRHVTMLLSGEGGDEIFNAYETHRACRARELYRGLAPAALRRLIRGLARLLPVSLDKLSFDFVAKRFTEGVELDDPEAHLYWRHAVDDAGKAALLPSLRGLPPTARLFAELFHSVDFPDRLDRISLIDLRYYFIDDLMVKNDRMMMAHSVEARFPYMGREVVELATRIPARLRLKGLRGRHIQKLAMRGSIPEAVERRGNMGLETPCSLWFLRGLRPMAERYFTRERVSRTGLLDYPTVAALWEEHAARKRDNGRALWAVLNFLVWFDRFVYEGDYKKHLVR